MEINWNFIFSRCPASDRAVVFECAVYGNCDTEVSTTISFFFLCLVVCSCTSDCSLWDFPRWQFTLLFKIEARDYCLKRPSRQLVCARRWNHREKERVFLKEYIYLYLCKNFQRNANIVISKRECVAIVAFSRRLIKRFMRGKKNTITILLLYTYYCDERNALKGRRNKPTITCTVTPHIVTDI